MLPKMLSEAMPLSEEPTTGTHRRSPLREGKRRPESPPSIWSRGGSSSKGRSAKKR